MGASTSLLLMKKDSTIILEALEDVTENGSKALTLQDLPSLDLSLVESLVSIARIQAGPRLLGQLEHFSIKDCRIRLSAASSPSSAAAAMQILTKFLREECRSLQEIDLSRNDLHNDDLAILCNQESGLGGHLTLTSLILRGNRFQGIAGGQCLRQLLTQDDDNSSHRAEILKLDLSENIWLGLHGIHSLSLGLAANQQCLQELVLQECLLDDEGVAMLTDSMLHPGSGKTGCGGGVRILNLSRNHMTPASLRSLSRLLVATASSSTSCCLEVLDVSHNNSLFDEDIRHIEANANITDNNDIHTPTIASCVKTFAYALKGNRTMHHLNVQHCGIEHLGAKYIFRALEFNSTLRVMDIGNPYIKSPAGLDYMIQSIPKMKGLQHVKVFIMSTPSPWQQEKLVHALHKNTTLCSLASYCEWSNKTCFQMEGIFFRNWGMARVSALLQLPKHDHDEIPVASATTPKKTIAPPAPSVWCQALAALGRNASGATPVFQVLQAMLPASLNDEPDVADCKAHVNSNDINTVTVAKNDKAAIPSTTVQDPQVSSKSNNYLATKSSYTATSLLLWCVCLLWRILHRFWYFFASPVHALNNKDAFFCWWEIHAAQAIAAIHAKKNYKNRHVKHDGVTHEKLE